MEHRGAHDRVDAVDRGGRAALVADAHAGAVRGVLLGNALQVLHGHAGDLSVLVHGVLVHRLREEREARAHLHAVHLALVLERALAARGVQRRLPGGGVDDHVLLDGLAVLVLLLGRIDAGVGRAHELAVVRMVLVDDDQVRGVRIGAVPSLDSRLLGGEGDGVGVVGLVGDDLLHERSAERSVRCGLDGDPVDARDGGRHGTVGERAVEHVDLELPGREVLERALAGALEVDHAAAREGAQPDCVLGLLRLGGEAVLTCLCQRTR